MAAIARNTAARNAVATVAAPRKAPARDTAAPRTAPALVVSIDGAAPVAVPFGLADFTDAMAFVTDVVAALVWAETGLVVGNRAERNVGTVASRMYAGSIDAGAGKAKRTVQFAFGPRALVTAYRSARNEAAAIDAPAPAPVSAEKPAPAKAKATPQVAPLAGMTPLGLKPAAPVADRPAKALPAPAVAAALKSTAAAARDARTFVMVRVTVDGFGAFDVHANRSDMADAAAFARLHIAPRVAQFHEWARVTVDYASRAGGCSFAGAVSCGGKRQAIAWCECPVTASPPALPLPLRAGMGNAPRSAAPLSADALAARMGIKPAGSALAKAEANAKAAGVKLSRTDRMAAEAIDAAAVRTAAGTVKADAAPKMSAGTRAVFEAAAKGTLPPAPDFTAPTHERYRGKLAELVALVRKGDVAALKAYHINAISTSPKALDRYRNAAVIALTAKAEKKAARLAA